MQNKILILGFGHLAKILTPKLIDDYKVIATKRSEYKDSLQNLEVIQFDLAGPLPEIINQTKFCAIICFIPPRDELIQFLQDKILGEIPFIYTSSTGVYGQGAELKEDSPLEGKRRNSLKLIEIERLLKENYKKSAVLRCGGLVDLKRHPANFFKEKSQIESGEQNVNLIHCEDVCNVIIGLLNNQIPFDTYNLVSDEHKTKKEFYGPLLKKWQDRDVEFDSSGETRIVSNEKLKKTKFSFQYPELFQYFMEHSPNS